LLLELWCQRLIESSLLGGLATHLPGRLFWNGAQVAMF
jgi:hypothetical protein